jgi:flagellar hook-length control protein FliK
VVQTPVVQTPAVQTPVVVAAPAAPPATSVAAPVAAEVPSIPVEKAIPPDPQVPQDKQPYPDDQKASPQAKSDAASSPASSLTPTSQDQRIVASPTAFKNLMVAAVPPAQANAKAAVEAAAPRRPEDAVKAQLQAQDTTSEETPSQATSAPLAASANGGRPDAAHGHTPAKPDTQDGGGGTGTNGQSPVPSATPAAAVAAVVASASDAGSDAADALAKTTDAALNRGASQDAPAGVPTVIGTADHVAKPSADSAGSASAAQDPPAVDRQQLLDQVLAGMRGKLDARNGEATIRLDPPNMGTLQVKVQLENGTLNAQFLSDQPLVRGLLTEHMDRLRSVLEGQGIVVDRLVVPVPAPASGSSGTSGGPTQWQGNGSDAQQQPGSQQRGGGGSQGQNTRDSSAPAALWQDKQESGPLDLVA